MQNNLDEFICGGYFLTKYYEDAKQISSLLPDRILSASSCIVDLYPDRWLYELPDNQTKLKGEAKNYATSVSLLPELLNWTTSNLDSHLIGYPNVFYSLEKVREFARFRDDNKVLSIVGLGLKQNLVDEYFESEKEDFGVFECLKINNSLEPDGEILGYEVLGNEWTHFHTWLCYGVINDCETKFEIKPNANGFIENLEDALKCAEYSIQEDIGSNGIFWQPWLIVKYET